MEIITLKIDEVQPYERNPRHNEEAVSLVASSIREFGFNVPILLDTNKVIVAGHTRLEALKQAGVDEVECIELNHLTEEQENAFRIADNRAADFSFWDRDLLQQEMVEIGAEDWEKFGFNDKDLAFMKAPDRCTCPKCGKTFIKV